MTNPRKLIFLVQCPQSRTDSSVHQGETEMSLKKEEGNGAIAVATSHSRNRDNQPQTPCQSNSRARRRKCTESRFKSSLLHPSPPAVKKPALTPPSPIIFFGFPQSRLPPQPQAAASGARALGTSCGNTQPQRNWKTHESGAARAAHRSAPTGANSSRARVVPCWLKHVDATAQSMAVS
jgi:hypothetical protein